MKHLRKPAFDSRVENLDDCTAYTCTIRVYLPFWWIVYAEYIYQHNTHGTSVRGISIDWYQSALKP